ncbi:MAG: ABC transporter permease subunit [Alphaproteobacteria bacterium]|nr:ABC transporter permease subunit [Alphaproteobacteria bacterium]
MAVNGGRREIGRRLVDNLVLLLVIAGAWQAMHDLAGSVALSSPLTTLSGALELLRSADFWPNVTSTFRAFLLALVIAIGGGVLIGLVLGSSRLLAEAYEPALMAFYTVPKVSFFPIILLFCGIGLATEVVFGAIHGIVPVAIFTLNAARNVRVVFLKTARVMGLTRAQAWLSILLPSSVPEVFTGIRIGVSLTFIGTILSEMFGSHQGIGYMLMQAIGSSNGDMIFSLTFLIIAFAVAVSTALLAIDRRLHRRV